MPEDEILVRFIYNIFINVVEYEDGLIVSSLYPLEGTNGISVQQFVGNCDELYCKKRALTSKKLKEFQGFYGLGAIKTKTVQELPLQVKYTHSDNNPYHTDIIISQKFKKNQALPQETIQLLDDLAFNIKLFKDVCPQDKEKWCGEKINETMTSAN